MVKLQIVAVCFVLILCLNELADSYQFSSSCPFSQIQAREYYASGYEDVFSAAATPALANSEIGSISISTHGSSDIIHQSEANPISHNGLDTTTFLADFYPKQIDKLECTTPPVNCSSVPFNNYYRSFDGSCNNLRFSGFGMAKSRYGRMLRPKYSDGVYKPATSVKDGVPLPNARLISLSLYGDTTLPDSFRTLAFLQWGQIVAHDISQSTTKGAPKDCCENLYNKQCYPIALHPNGPISTRTGASCLHFARVISDFEMTCAKSGLPYNEKMSLVTAYLDLSSVYGNSVEQSQKVRQFAGGLLKTSRINNRHWMPVSSNNDGECGEDRDQCYSIPDMRNQFTPTIAVLHTIFLREHNRIARVLAQFNPHYSDEQLFQVARKINIAQYQKITYYDWLPLIIGTSYAHATNLIYYVQANQFVNDYDPTVDPSPYAEYAAAAFRYAHNQIPGWFTMMSPNRERNQTYRLSDYFERPENVNLLAHGNNFDSLVRGMVTQLQKRPDSNIDKEMKHFFDRKLTEEFGTDLKAIDIQRGRDYGLPSYNDFREYCGLPRAFDWSGFSNEISADKIIALQKLYVSPDDVELSVGGSLETHVSESILGPVFQCIIGRQFLKTRTADRFFFEREDILSGFYREQLAEIRKATLSGLLCNNADYLQVIQPNSFIFPNGRNLLRKCNTILKINLSKWTEPQQQVFLYG